MTKQTLSLLIVCSSLSLLAAGCTKTATVQKAVLPSNTEVKQSVTVNNPNATPTQAEVPKGVTTTQAKPATAVKKPAVVAPTKTLVTQQEKNANQLAPATAYVTIKDAAFSPQIISVKAGGTVVWTNKDAVAHTTKSDGALLWDSGSILPNGSYRHVFKAVGTYPYSCGIHPSMHGSVYVY